MKKGFTLVELLVSFLILSIMTYGVFTILNVANLTWDISGVRLQLQQNTRQAVDGMVKELRQSSGANITVAAGLDRVDFTIPVFLVNASSTTFSSTISYYLNATSSQLVRENPAGTIKVLSNNINGVTFCCNQGGGVCDTNCATTNIFEVRLNSTKTVRQRPLIFNLLEKVRLRND